MRSIAFVSTEASFLGARKTMKIESSREAGTAMAKPTTASRIEP